MKSEPNSYSEYLESLEPKEEQWIDEFDEERYNDYDENYVLSEEEIKNLPFL